MKEVLEHFPAALALVTAAVFFMTVVHEWAYFMVIGPHLQTTMSSVDYLSNAILWLPWYVLLLLAGNAVGFLFTKGAGALWGRRRPWRRLWIVVGFFIVLNLIIVVAAPTFRLAFSVLTGTLVLMFGLAAALRKKDVGLLTRRVIVTIVNVLFLLSITFVMGNIEAHADLLRKDQVYRLERKNEEEAKQVLLLRSLSRGLLVYDAVEQRVSLLAWDEIKGLSQHKSVVEPYVIWPLCALLGNCKPEPAPPI